MDELEATLIYSGESTDDTVATLLQGKWIYGNSVGTVSITISDCNSRAETVYDVTVIHNPDVHFEPVFFDDKGNNDYEEDLIPDNKGYIGYCYNVFSGNEFNQTAVSGMKQIFDWDYKVDYDYFTKDTTPTAIATLYTAKTKSEYLKAVSEKLSAKLVVKFGKFTLYSKTWSNNSSHKIEEKNFSSVNQIYVELGEVSYALGNKECTNTGYYNYLKDDVKLDLDSISSEQDVERFTKKYGTHVAVETLLGKSLEVDYALIEDERNDPFWADPAGAWEDVPYDRNYKDYLIRYNNEGMSTNMFFECVRMMVERYKNEKEWGSMLRSEIYRNNLTVIDSSIESHLKILGGDEEVFFAHHLCSGQILENMFIYLNHDKHKALLSTKNSPEKSLIPLWELIPTDTAEGKKRKEVFKNYVTSKMEK